MEVVKLDKNYINDIANIDKATFPNPWLEKQWDYEINENPVATVIGVIHDGKLIGYLDYWITFDSASIAKICILDEYKRQGIASMMMRHMIKDLKEHEVFYLTLEVRVSNEAAINLYKKFKFEKVTIKPHYYVDGEDALYMMRGVLTNE